ncbi:MAG TPA: sialate O-acetylesterase [Caulobacterales bacterium]|nr:sialate O-acetylesterase [Caulobacterales bacterium]
MFRMAGAAALAAMMVIGASSAAAQSADHPLLHPMFADHAVLQRGKPIPVWGWARPGETVTVTLDHSTARARADRSGVWRANLPSRAEGGPFTLSARTAHDTETISDVLVGDVYLCSGQSNMEFQTRYATNSYTTVNGAADNQLRLFNVTRRIADTPQANFDAPDHWTVAAPDTVGDFSAVCYFFGRNLRQTQNIPIGLIHPSWGGTVIEAWMSADAFHRLPGYETQLALAEQNRRDPAGAQAAFARIMANWWSQNDPGGRAGYFNTDFNDSSWATINAGGDWENAGVPELAGFDGIVWYRSEFTLTAAQAAQGGELQLGPADDIDATYLNGQPLGSTFGWDTPRHYAVAPGSLHAGRNVLASAVLDTGGGGGWWGPADQKVLRLADGSSVPLAAQPWRYHISAQLSDVKSPPQPPGSGPNSISVLYNGMIAPVAPYGLSGALWYQGEANANAPDDYARLLPGMMADWRRSFANPTLPFFIVQLTSYGPPSINTPRGGWGAIRDVERRVAAADGHAALATIIDVGDRYDIHPTQKLIVGERLARLARRMIYHEDIVDSGPTPVSAARQGDEVVVHFEHVPLVSYSSNRPMAFELCDQQRACRFVDASISGADVHLDARGGASAFVRYCWGDGVICNLFNDSDLPAAPFELAVR